MAGSFDKYKKQVEASKVDYETRSFRLPIDLMVKLSILADRVETSSNDMLRRILESELSDIKITPGLESKYKSQKRNAKRD